MKRRGSRAKQSDSHVRLYGWELNCPAYRTLSTDARALLVEIRALYSGKCNCVFLSVREAMARLNVGQRRAQKAFGELTDRGWIQILEKGAFSRKTKLATTFALTNEPLEQRDGGGALKSYMHWKPQLSTVAEPATVGSQRSYRSDPQPLESVSLSSRYGYRNPEGFHSSVANVATQIGYQESRGEVSPLSWIGLRYLNDEEQICIIFWWLLGSANIGDDQ